MAGLTIARLTGGRQSHVGGVLALVTFSLHVLYLRP